MMTDQKKIKEPIPELIPRLLPLEYCNLPRAAKMLNIEVDDIKHFNEVRRIKLYLRKEEISEGEQWDEDFQDYIPCDFYVYEFIPFFVDEKMGVDNDDIYIKYAELEVIHAAIYGNEKLPEPTIRKARTESGQCDLIFALIQSIKKLKGCFDKEKVKDAEDLIREYLVSKGVNEQIILNERTITGWRERSVLFYPDENKNKNKNKIKK